MVTEHGVSERQACKAVQLPRSTYQYKHKEKDDIEIITLLGELVDKHPSIGFWSCFYRLRNMGYGWNHKHVYRVYTAMQLNIRRRAKKRIPARVKQEHGLDGYSTPQVLAFAVELYEAGILIIRIFTRKEKDDDLEE